MSSYVVVGTLTLFFVVMALIAVRRTGRFGQIRWTVAGEVTYPLYLLHQIIGFAVFNVTYPSISPHVLLWTTIGVMLALSYAVHVGVERTLSPPLRRLLAGRTLQPSTEYRAQPAI
jgi:peptidoglycan/LPS O-acetylase OafA/YrhL